MPAGLELAPFQAWLPASHGVGAVPASASRDLITTVETQPAEAPRGVSLSQLLAGVERAVAEAYQQGVWTRVDVVNVNLNIRNKHIYLELSERDEDGNVVAQARGTIWARTAERILPQFQRETGAQLAPGIKLLVLAKPVFKAQYGLSLDITGIDASYTIGDLEAQKRKIREHLQAEKLFDRNKQLPPPWDFSRVLVVAPQVPQALVTSMLKQSGCTPTGFASSSMPTADSKVPARLLKSWRRCKLVSSEPAKRNSTHSSSSAAAER